MIPRWKQIGGIGKKDGGGWAEESLRTIMEMKKDFFLVRNAKLLNGLCHYIPSDFRLGPADVVDRRTSGAVADLGVSLIPISSSVVVFGGPLALRSQHVISPHPAVRHLAWETASTTLLVVFFYEEQLPLIPPPPKTIFLFVSQNYLDMLDKIDGPLKGVSCISERKSFLRVNSSSGTDDIDD